MGKLNIAHHKSYHPYRRDNIERVRRDEEENRLKEEKEEGRMLLADSEARIDLLREKASITSKKSKGKRKDDDMAILTAGSSIAETQLPTTNGHINFFQDLEQSTIVAAIKASKKAAPAETEKGVPLAPSAKDLKPWYSEHGSELVDDVPDDKKKREENRKSAHDPLTSITKQLASRSSTSAPSKTKSLRPPPVPSSSSLNRPPEVQARLSRENSERQRALELITRRKREMEGSATPSTVYGGSAGYSDVFNRREVEEAHHHWRDRQPNTMANRRWDADDDRRRNSETFRSRR